MCRSMNEFNELVVEIQRLKAEATMLKQEIETKEAELKAYMRKRKKEELFSPNAALTVSYKGVLTPRFNKDLYIQKNGKEDYQKYVVASTSMRLDYLKPKKAGGRKTNEKAGNAICN